MQSWLDLIYTTFLGTIRDILPIVLVLGFFQLAVIREKLPNLKQILIGSVYVVVGLALFLVGLEKALFPIGKEIARDLSSPELLGPLADGATRHWLEYYWIYIFAFAIGFATTIAEPSLIAVAIKARAISGGAVTIWGLRISVALGVALSLTFGTFRIVTGTPLYFYMIAGYAIVMVQTMFAPRLIVPLAYDSGGVTTSTVTVPIVAALGLGLAGTVPGRSPLLDGFGLIALASLFPMMTVMGYAQIGEWRLKRSRKSNGPKTDESLDKE